MDKTTEFYKDLSKNKDAKWIMDFINDWDKYNNSIISWDEENLNSHIYLNNEDNIKNLIYAAWEHYIGGNNGKD